MVRFRHGNFSLSPWLEGGVAAQHDCQRFAGVSPDTPPIPKGYSMNIATCMSYLRRLPCDGLPRGPLRLIVQQCGKRLTPDTISLPRATVWKRHSLQ